MRTEITRRVPAINSSGRLAEKIDQASQQLNTGQPNANQYRGFFRQRPFQHRRAVDKGAVLIGVGLSGAQLLTGLVDFFCQP